MFEYMRRIAHVNQKTPEKMHAPFF